MTDTDPLAGTRVLIVDDQRMFVDALTRIVEDAGMAVDGVAGSIAELDAMREVAVDAGRPSGSPRRPRATTRRASSASSTRPRSSTRCSKPRSSDS